MTDYPGALHAFIDASGKADTALSSSVAYHYPYWDGVSGALPGTLGDLLSTDGT